MSLDQYWSVEPNYTVGYGMTTPRLHELAALVETSRREDMYSLGAIVSMAVNSPKDLRKLKPREEARRIDMRDLGPLAPVKRRNRDPHG